MGYSDHSDLHEPFDPRAAARHEPGVLLQLQEQAEYQQSRRESVSPEEQERQRAALQESRQQRQAAAHALVADLSDRKVILMLVSGFDEDARAFSSPGVRSNIDRFLYNALRLRYLGEIKYDR